MPFVIQWSKHGLHNSGTEAIISIISASVDANVVHVAIPGIAQAPGLETMLGRFHCHIHFEKALTYEQYHGLSRSICSCLLHASSRDDNLCIPMAKRIPINDFISSSFVLPHPVLPFGVAHKLVCLAKCSHMSSPQRRSKKSRGEAVESRLALGAPRRHHHKWMDVHHRCRYCHWKGLCVQGLHHDPAVGMYQLCVLCVPVNQYCCSTGGSVASSRVSSWADSNGSWLGMTEKL